MDFEEYWSDLVDRAGEFGEGLDGVEERVFRLTCIYGETMVDGIESYFARRWSQVDADARALRETGFPDVAAEFAAARRLIFRDA